MASSIFNLMGSIFIDNQAANASIQATVNNGQTAGEKIGNAFAKLGQATAKIGQAVLTAALDAGKAIYGMATDSAEAADRVDKLSQQIGLSREGFQELDFILSQAGASVENLKTGMKTLTNQMLAAENGTGSAVEIFDRLGVSIYDANGELKSQEQMLYDVMEALAKITNQTEKATIANKLFGKTGSELMPLLNSETGTIEELRKQAHELGLVMSDEIIDSGVNLHDSLDQTKRSFDAITLQLGAAFMPIVEEVSDYIRELLPTLLQIVQKVGPAFATIIRSILPPIMELVDQLLPVLVDIINGLMPSISEIISAILPVLVKLLQTLLPPVLKIVQAVLPVAVQLLNALLPVLEPLIDLLVPILDLVVDIIEPLMEIISAVLPPMIELFADLYTILWANVIPVITSLTRFIGINFKNALGAITEVMRSVVSVAKSVFTEMNNVINSVLSSISSTVSNAMGRVNSSFSNGWNNIRNNVKNGIDTVKKAFTELTDTAKTWGKDMIDNFIDGFKSRFEKLKGNMKELANLIREYIHFSEPDVGPLSDFHTYAPDMMDLFAKGVKDNEEKVAAQMAESFNFGNFITGPTDASSIQSTTATTNAALNQIINALNNVKVVMDTGELVGVLATPMDNALGNLAIRERRGVI